MPGLEIAWRKAATALAPLAFDRSAQVAQLLLAHVLQVERAHLFAYPLQTLSAAQQLAYDAILLRHQQGEPLSYILGEVEFFSNSFLVNKQVLIPRPETELLVEQAIAQLAAHECPTILDLGTGSGAIAVSLAKALPAAHILAIDKSEAALSVARMNAARHDCLDVQFICSDWFCAVPLQQFDCIVSNPPYVSLADWQATPSLHYEPVSAFIGGTDGLDAYQAIAAKARHYLTREGVLLLEHGSLQADAVRDILQQEGYSDIFSVHDLSGHVRITCASR